MAAPLRFTPVGVAASAGRIGSGPGMGSGARVALTPETQAALVQSHYHGPGSGGGAGMHGMDAGQDYSVQTAGVSPRRYAIAIVVLVATFIFLPVMLLKMLGLF